MAESALGVLQTPPRMFFKAQLCYAGLIGKFDRIIDGRHAFYDASEINAALAGVQTRIARQLDHAFAGVRDTGQSVRDVKKIQ
jgi:hypothetical protein